MQDFAAVEPGKIEGFESMVPMRVLWTLKLRDGFVNLNGRLPTDHDSNFTKYFDD